MVLCTRYVSSTIRTSTAAVWCPALLLLADSVSLSLFSLSLPPARPLSYSLSLSLPHSLTHLLSLFSLHTKFAILNDSLVIHLVAIQLIPKVSSHPPIHTISYSSSFFLFACPLLFIASTQLYKHHSAFVFASIYLHSRVWCQLQWLHFLALPCASQTTSLPRTLSLSQ